MKIIVTGASGMVGEGVLQECLLHSQVEKVLVVGRRHCGWVHPKLTEIIHKDFFDLLPIKEQLAGYEGCFFCLGVSSVGMKEEEYREMTYTLTMNFAQTVSSLNKNMVFCYVSGSGTDSTEKGRLMWARIKGKTENDLVKLPFKDVYNFRPGIMKPSAGAKNVLSYYKYFGWLYPFFRAIMPAGANTLKEVGLAMIQAAKNGYEKHIIDGKDITILAGRPLS